MSNKQKLKNYIDFVWAMTEKEIKARYKHTVFGFLWLILNPILQMVIIGFIFSFFIRLPVENYYLFLFSGLLPWQFFSLSLTKATPSFVYERYLLQKSNFPREVIPLSIIFSNFLHFIISIILLVGFLILKGDLIFPQILYVFPASFLLLTFVVGTSFFTSTLQVKYRDINFFVQSLLIVWFYATPIIYNLELIPDRIRSIFYLNPLSYIFELFHISVIHQSIPNLNIFISNFLVILLVSVVGLFIFKKECRYFVDWL